MDKLFWCCLQFCDLLDRFPVEQVSEWVSEWVSGRVCEAVSVWAGVWASECVGGWASEWIGESRRSLTRPSFHTHARTYAHAHAHAGPRTRTKWHRQTIRRRVQLLAVAADAHWQAQGFGQLRFGRVRRRTTDHIWVYYWFADLANDMFFASGSPLRLQQLLQHEHVDREAITQLLLCFLLLLK